MILRQVVQGEKLLGIGQSLILKFWTTGPSEARVLK